MAVGELPAHNHSASTNTTGSHTHTIKGAGGIGAGAGLLYGIPNSGPYTTTSAGNHSHVITINTTGSNQAHNNLQPYISIYIWKRIA